VQCLTKQDPQSVADFYSSKVPGNGWTEASTGSTSGQLYANYTNEASGGNLVITMSPSQDYAGYTEVDIILTTGQ
jgi:hypothetical protein